MICFSFYDNLLLFLFFFRVKLLFLAGCFKFYVCFIAILTFQFLGFDTTFFLLLFFRRCFLTFIILFTGIIFFIVWSISFSTILFYFSFSDFILIWYCIIKKTKLMLLFLKASEF